MGNSNRPLEKNERILVDDKEGRVIFAAFETHVYRNLVSVEFGDGQRDLVEADRIQRLDE